MRLVVATTIGLVVWVLAWSLGAKGFDALMIGVAIVLVAATTELVLRYLPANRE